MTLMNKERAKALHDFLSWCHAEQYGGLDDEMSDNCEEWIGELTDEEVASLAVETFKNGL